MHLHSKWVASPVLSDESQTQRHSFRNMHWERRSAKDREIDRNTPFPQSKKPTSWKKNNEYPPTHPHDSSRQFPVCSVQHSLVQKPGAFGQVRIATDLKSEQSYAVKVADVRAKSVDPDQTPISTKRLKSIEREIEMWTLASEAGDPHITRLFASWP